MEHLDPERAALAALGEHSDDLAVQQHLAACEACRREVAQLRETVDVARSTLGESTLERPPARVWSGIRDELGLDADLDVTALHAVSVPHRESTTVRSRRDERRAHRSRRVIAIALPALAAAAAAAIITAVALGAVPAATPPAAPVAAATLAPLPAWTGASGDAVVIENDGGRVIDVRLDAPVADDSVREVWLLTPEIDGLISLGLLEGDSGSFVVPDSVDLERFSVVDISAEPLDGDPAHSGDSIVRGALES